MPYVHVIVSEKLGPKETEALRDAVAGKMSLLPGKTRENTMIHISAGEAISKGDGGEPAAFVEARLYRESPAEAKTAFAAEVTELLTRLGIPAKQVYMNFLELEHWASGGVYR